MKPLERLILECPIIAWAHNPLSAKVVLPPANWDPSQEMPTPEEIETMEGTTTVYFPVKSVVEGPFGEYSSEIVRERLTEAMTEAGYSADALIEMNSPDEEAGLTLVDKVTELMTMTQQGMVDNIYAQLQITELLFTAVMQRRWELAITLFSQLKVTLLFSKDSWGFVDWQTWLDDMEDFFIDSAVLEKE